MRKFMVLAVVLALLAPASAYAATEFSLGGFIKLNTFWDSTQNISNLTNPVNRDNDANFHHGRLNMKSQESRFNFTIKGPKAFGAQTSGILEMDFDGNSDNVTFQQGGGTSGTWAARLRLAMFRLNWPDTELMFGQYHSIFATWQVDAAESSALQVTGTVTARLPQIRLTQKFAGDWSVAGMVGLPQGANLTSGTPYSVNATNGSAAETPQIQGSVAYAHDWWGKAAYFGVPTPFTAQVTAGWQRNISRNAIGQTLLNFGQNNYVTDPGNVVNQKFVNPWLVQGTLFIPVIPTHSANLSGTASILTQWFVGQGVEAFGVAGNSSNLYKLLNDGTYDPSLLSRWGGFVQGQYYFTNQWYVNAAYGISSSFGVDRARDSLLAGTDQFRTMQQVDATLWYRPIQALKFGVQYSFAQTKWLQSTTTGTTPATSDLGNEHRVQFVAFYFF